MEDRYAVQDDEKRPENGPCPILIRPSRIEDIRDITDIYGYHVVHGLASFEETPPDVEEMTARRARIVSRQRPYVVAERDGRVVGYAYASDYRTRVAYRFTLEDTVYVAPDEGGRGLGSLLLERVIAECTRLGYRQLIAVIGDSNNRPSIALHEKAGFQHAGQFHAVGFKFGRWVDSVLMQRPLGPAATSPPAADPIGFRS